MRTIGGNVSNHFFVVVWFVLFSTAKKRLTIGRSGKAGVRMREGNREAGTVMVTGVLVGVCVLGLYDIWAFKVGTHLIYSRNSFYSNYAQAFSPQ